MATKSKIVIDGTYALSLLTEVVQEAGEDYVYPRFAGCDYARHGKPSCLVGQALSKAGVSVKRLQNLDCAPRVVSTGIRHLQSRGILARRGILLTNDAAEIFSAAQARQDDGATWGTALEAARKVA